MKLEMITISKAEYNSLLENSEFLSFLNVCGVDNWGGYDDACAMMDEEDGD